MKVITQLFRLLMQLFGPTKIKDVAQPTRPAREPDRAPMPPIVTVTDPPSPARDAVIAFTYHSGRSVACVCWSGLDGDGHREFDRPGNNDVAAHGVLLDAFEFVTQLPEPSQGGVTRLYIAHRTTRSAVLALASAFPGIELVSDAHPVDPTLFDQAKRRAQAGGTASISLPTRVLTVATDASASRNRRGLGIAFVSEDGRHGQTYVSSSANIHHGELRAVELALSSLPGRLRILTDSQATISWVSDPSSAPSHALQRLAGRVASTVNKRGCQLEWVRGHSGHPLNETADRLAMAARRAAQLRQPDTTREQIALNIVADLAVSYQQVPTAA